jgi:hypothetical protein
MNELLFHSSWWLLGCVALGGIAFFIVGNRRLDKNLQRIGVAIVLVTAVLGLMRFFFPTPRERMEKRSRDIVHAVDHRDWTSLQNLLDKDTAVCNRSGVMAGGRDAIIARTKFAMDQVHVKSVSILGVDSVQNETLITVSLEIFSTQEDTQDRPVTSSWQMEYEQSGDQWILTKITALRIGSDTNQNFSPMLPQN